MRLTESVDYKKRATLVYQALALASSLDYNCGIRFDNDAKWPVIAIELPNVGEVAWHNRATDLVYEDYTTEEKYRRLRLFVER